VTDPVGARFGLWQGKGFVGTRLVNGYGTFIFNYLYTDERERALDFYREVFGYREARRSIDGDLVRADNHTVAAITTPEELDEEDMEELEGPVQWPGTTAWLTYFAVRNADRAVDRLADAGGQVVIPVQEYPWGRIAAVRDPLGAPFQLIEPWDVI
jgi:predicted enzyme related to lactoylglutathione lyase